MPYGTPAIQRKPHKLHIFHVGGKSGSNSKVYEIPRRYTLCFATRVLSNLLPVYTTVSYVPRSRYFSKDSQLPSSDRTICHLPFRSNLFKQQTASSPSENHVRGPTFLRNSLSPRLTTPDTSTDREAGCVTRQNTKKGKKGEKTEEDKKLS